MNGFIKRTLSAIMIVLVILTSAPLSGFVGMDWSWLELEAKAAITGNYTLNEGESISCFYDKYGTNCILNQDPGRSTVTITGKTDDALFTFHGERTIIHNENGSSVKYLKCRKENGDINLIPFGLTDDDELTECNYDQENIDCVLSGKETVSYGNFCVGDSFQLTVEKGTVNITVSWPNMGDPDISFGKIYYDQTEPKTITFGAYPQTLVIEENLIANLEMTSPTIENWNSYNYYISEKQSNYMKYYDVEYNYDKYRGVYFEKYRPYTTKSSSSESYSSQDNNGYEKKEIYWFKYEPLSWRVLDGSSGYVMCENIVDSQAFQAQKYSIEDEFYADPDGKSYANNWEYSTIREWLNNDFYNTAFNSTEKALITKSALDTPAYSDTYSIYSAGNTMDNIYIPSYKDFCNVDYGFPSNTVSKKSLLITSGTDYAKIQGLSVGVSNGNSSYYTRTPGIDSQKVLYVTSSGFIKTNSGVSRTSTGVRPAMRLSSIDIKESDEPAISDNEGKTDTNKKNGSFTVTTKQSGFNEKFFKLTEVDCFINDNQIKQKESKFEISQKDIDDNIILKKSGFRDYIIPYMVAKAFSDGYNFDAYMSLDKKDSKPYISSVFAKNSFDTQYRDLFKSSIVAENDNTYDVVMSGVGLSSNAIYYIGQDSSHKISSNTGTFSMVDLYSELVPNKTVYVYAVDNGVTTDLEEISLSKSSDDGALKRMLEMSTYSLGGSGGITIKIPDENPIFGNSEISLNAFSAPITIYYDATNDTFIGTIGFDLYSYTQKDKTVTNASGSLTNFGDGETKKAFQNFKESFSYFNKKPFAEDEKDKNGKSYKDQWTSFVNRCKTASKYSQEYGDSSFSTDFLGYLEFAITEQGFTIKEASLKIGAEFSYSYTYQGAVWVIPAYFKATLGASASLEGKGKRAMVDKEIPFEYEISLDIEPELGLEAGIGVEALAKAGVEAKGTAPLNIEFLDQHITLRFHGEINIKTKAFIFTWDKTLCEGEIDVLDKYWGTTNTYVLRRGTVIPQYAVLVDETETESLVDYYNESTSIADRSYNENTSEWLSNENMLMTSEDSEVIVKQLQTSVLEEGKPVAITFGDKILMAWIEDCADRDTYNRMRLMYSIYNGTFWSEPEAVCDDGKNDDAPVLATDGTDVYFAWQKINAILDENSVVTETLQQVDVCTARYDTSSGTIKDAKIICSDNGYDYAQTITIHNGEPVIYFASCSDPSVAVSYNNKINKYENNTVTPLASAISFVQSIVAEGEDMSFIIDTDGDLSTSNDINVFSYSSGYSTEFEKKDIHSAIIGAYYGYIDNEKVLFVTDGANIYYDLNNERKSVFSKTQNISSLNLVEQNGNPVFLWTDDVESGNQICFVNYDEASWSSPVVLTKAEGYYFDRLDMVNYNDNLVGVFMQNELKYNEDSESYDISQVNLAYITIEDYMDLKVGSVFVEEETLVPGDTAEICVYVENLGTETINNVEFTLFDSNSDIQTTEVEIELAPGENKNIYIDYVVPENFKQTALTVSAKIINGTDVDITNNSLTETIGLPDIRIIKTECTLDGNYYVVTAFINNNSVTAISNLKAKLWLDEEDGSIYHEATLKSLANDECGYVQFYVEKSALIFNETGTAKLYLVVESENSKYGRTATKCVLITKTEKECAHPVMETVERREPTCVEKGNVAYEVCLGCKEKLDYVELPSTGHSWKNATCTVAKTCLTCGTTEGEVLTHTDANGDYKCDYGCGHEFAKPTVPSTESTTMPSVENTTKPVETTKPAETTAKPVETTKPVEPTTAKPVDTTKPVENTTAKPVETTTQTSTEPTTKAPVENTTQPTTQPSTAPSIEFTTKAPVEITTKPAETTKPSTESTTKPSTEPITKPSEESTTKPSEEPTTNHTHKIVVLPAVKPTYKKSGKTEGKKCSECGTILAAQRTVARKKLKKVTSLKKKSVKLASGSKTTLTLSWKKVTGAEKYVVQQYVNKKWKTVASTKKTYYTVKKLKANKSYKFRVRAKAGKYYGSYSKTYTAKTVPLKPTVKVKAGKKQLTASWKTVANITGYEVQYSTSKKFTKKTTQKVTIKKAKTKKTSIKKLKKGKKYFVKVRAYKTVGKKKIYGAWSTVKTVKVK